jgi:HlyD family secretion protein
MSDLRKPAQHAIRRHLVAGLAVVAMVGIGVGGWAATAKMAGAVIAPGNLVVDSSVKKVQHPTGGIVGELRVRDGDRVKAGDIIVRLDDTQTRAQVAIVTKGLDELAARQARLEAERDDAAVVVFPASLVARLSDPDVAHAIVGERKLFELRRAAASGQKAQLRERIAQVREEVQALTGQEAAKQREIKLDGEELEGVRELWHKHLVPINRMKSLERDVARLEGESSQLLGAVAQAKGKIAEIELQIIQVDQDLRSEVGKDLAEVRAKTSELIERKIAAEDQLKRIDIRAPQDGRVHQLTVHTVGGVISPGDPIMLIVPDSDTLIVETKVAPQDIDQLHLGQLAILRFSAFSQRTTPELDGEVSVISPDLIQDQRSGVSYYTVRIAFSAEQAARLGEVKLIPGMPVEAFVQTGERTVLSYLVKPLNDQVAKALREK